MKLLSETNFYEYSEKKGYFRIVYALTRLSWYK